jgi:hypothetical protein
MCLVYQATSPGTDWLRCAKERQPPWWICSLAYLICSPLCANIRHQSTLSVPFFVGFRTVPCNSAPLRSTPLRSAPLRSAPLRSVQSAHFPTQSVPNIHGMHAVGTHSTSRNFSPVLTAVQNSDVLLKLPSTGRSDPFTHTLCARNSIRPRRAFIPSLWTSDLKNAVECFRSCQTVNVSATKLNGHV